MKVSFKQDSIAYQLGVRPGVLLRDMSKNPVSSTVKALNLFMGKDFKVASIMSKSEALEYKAVGNPEVDAILFYLMNHAVSIVRQKRHPYESLGEYLPLVEEYHNLLAMTGARMFFYMLLICTRESRHAKDYSGSLIMNKLEIKYGSVCVKFQQSLKGSSSSVAAQSLKTNPPDTDIGTYTAFLADLFHSGSFSSGYGGPAWGKVADVLRDFVKGKVSAEMMLDTSFTLCHNNGPIFNKGMLYDNYTSHIYKILDVQRSGQIPQLIANKETHWAETPEVELLYKKCSSVLGDQFSGYVDWFLVEELGAMGQYHDEKDKQKVKHGYPSKFKAKIEAEKAKKEMKIKKEKELSKLMVQLMPNLKVKKIGRPA